MPNPDSAIRPARQDEWDCALGMLVPHASVAERDDRVREALASVVRGELSLEGLLAAEQNGKIIGAGLSVLMPDGIAFVWPPAVSADHRMTAERAAGLRRELLSALSTDAETRGAVYAQALLEGESADEVRLLESCGYQFVAELDTLERSLADPLPPPAPLPGRIVAYQPGESDDRFARAIEATYVETLDCPGFTGRRSGRDAMESHRLAGLFDPSQWLLFEVDGADVAVLLQTIHPDLSAWEIVYTGVAPKARRRGFGRGLVIEALHRGAASGCRTAFLAVDATNTFACGLYRQLGFVATSRKRAWVRWSMRSNPQREHSPPST